MFTGVRGRQVVDTTYSLHSGEFAAGPRDYTHDLG
jgi:hypothetical protein